MNFILATIAVVAASFANASDLLVERNLQADCGGRGPCTRGASCVNNVCVCGNGWQPNPSVPDVKLAGWQSCIDIDECLTVSANICAPKAVGGVCIDHDPPVKYQCACDTKNGFIPTKTDPVFGPTACKKVNFFRRASVFNICEQLDAKCNTNTETLAEIVTASTDGNILIYTDAALKKVGFVDISNIFAPKALGTLDVKGEPTSVATKGDFALAVVNTSPNFINTSGDLVVIDIASQKVIARLPLGGQPDSIAVSPDGKYAVIAIENERNEDLGTGAPPQMPAGFVSIVDIANPNPLKWSATKVSLTDLPGMLYPTDPEPEFVSINSQNVAAVTLQENNAVVLIDLLTKKVKASFSAGSATANLVDATRDNVISLTQSRSNVLREPDGIAWLDERYFVTADEGDLNGGSRGFTVFDATNGTVVYASGNLLEHLSVKYGHYPEDRRTKGAEPENIAYGVVNGEKRLFVNAERANVVFVFDMTVFTNPIFVQVLPSGKGPEGGFIVPSRNLYVVASEVDARSLKMRSSISIYEGGFFTPSYPTLESTNRADGTPIPWSAMSGLAAEIRGSGSGVANIMYSVEDSIFKKSRIFHIDTSTSPAQLTKDYRLQDTSKLLERVPFGATLVNSDLTVNLDSEGIAVSKRGGFWIVSEGAGSADDVARPITSLNYLLKVSTEGRIENVITLPNSVNAIQTRWGFEGCAEGSGVFASTIVVVFQRAWVGEANPRIGAYDYALNKWTFYYYPLDSPKSQNGGWVGLSDIAPLGDGGKFLVIERDDQGGPDGVIKRIYKIDLGVETPGTTIKKTLELDIVEDLLKTRAPLFEKIEGLTVDRSGSVWVINDNDGLADNTGETQLLNVLASTYRPKFAGAPAGHEIVTFIHINDHHSHFDEQTIDLTSKSLIPPRLSVNTSNLRVFYGGFDRAVTVMNAMAAQATAEGKDVVKLHAGDALTGTLYYTFFGPKPDAVAMNVARFDALTIGNHEFDNGDKNLADFVKLVNGTTFLSANLKPRVGSALNDLQGEDKIQKYYIKTLKSGQKVGICGITIKATTELSSFPDKGTTVADEEATAFACVAELQGLGINKIGLLTHVGYSKDIALFTKIPGVSFIIGGHSHTLLGNAEYDKFKFPTQGKYATIVNNVCIVQAWEYVRVVGALTIEFDTKGNVAACTGAARVPLNPDLFQVRDKTPSFSLGKLDAAKATAWLVSQGPFVKAVEDQSVVQALKPYVDQLSAKSQEVIATAPEPICHTYGEASLACPGKEVRSRLGGGVCNLVSQGFLFNVPTADIALQNRGGCRVNIRSGQFTYGGAFEVLPFTNVLVTLVMTGDQIRRAIEDSMNFFLSLGGGGGSYAFAAGLRYDIDYSKPFGSRISNLEVNKRLKDTWKPIDLTAKYKVVTNDFIATPRDGYFTLGEINQNDPTVFENTFVLYAQSFIDFVKSKGVLLDPPLSEYSTQKLTLLNGTTYSVKDAA